MENIANNPWKGLDSYNSSDASYFYGRKEDTAALINAIVNNRITILYGPSGVGKSSILNAGAIPYFSQNNYLIVNINMRELDLRSYISISSQLIAAVETEAQKQEVEVAELIDKTISHNASDSLWFYFHSREFWSQKNELLVPLIIIDQFEEIFKDSVDEQKTSTFFSKLDELPNSVPPLSIRENIKEVETLNGFSQSAPFHFVFSLREDYLPRLDDYVYSLDIQELKKSRFSITPFEIKQAKEVIMKPIAGLVTEEVANKIVEILSSNNTARQNPRRIEPFLLSLYMFRVCEQMMKRNENTINEKLINEVGQDVVNDYYLESMGKVSTKAMKYLEKELLTQKGHRDSISLDRLLSSGKVSEKEIETLLSARILRKSTVNNVERIEFTHDILSKYAKLNKDNRERENRTALISGILGALVSIVLAIVIGILMTPLCTYIFIPILTTTFVFSALSIFRTSNSVFKAFISLISTFVIVGIMINLTQIIPGLGYIIYGIAAIAAFFIINAIRTKHLAKAASGSTILYSILTCITAITIIPALCFGYNFFNGMNYARSQTYQGRTFDSTLIPIDDGFIAKREGKYGLLNSNFRDSTEFAYDDFKMEDGKPYFYFSGKEIMNNGLGITWSPQVKESQKNTIREIVNNMVFIKGGSFSMGTNLDEVTKHFPNYRPSNGEEYVHKVRLTDYYLNQYEVTINDWNTIMEYDPRLTFKVHNNADSLVDPLLPVYKISYSQCESFINKLNSLSGIEFSLPTEAQWEYAAREGTKQSPYFFAGSNNLDDVGWFSKNSTYLNGNDTILLPHSVGSLNPNSLGLYDMTGNMLEYCKDCMSLTFYKESDGEENPCCDSGLIRRNKIVHVARGGSFLSDFKEGCVLTKRHQSPEDRYEATGFRLAINPNN